MEFLQELLDKINEKFGDVGSIVVVLLGMTVLFYAIQHMVFF